jgi:hypothetical protein
MPLLVLDDGELMMSRFDTTISEGRHKARNAAAVFYPSSPSPPLPLTLPLSSYAGIYHHPSYQTLTIALCGLGEKLVADRKDVTLPQRFTFEHVSGEFFTVNSEHVADFGALFPDVYSAEFKIGADGRVSEVGIAWEEEMGEEKIWLKRVD